MTEMKQKDTNLVRLGAAFFVLIVAVILGQLLGGVVVGMLAPDALDNPLVMWGLSLGPLYLLGLPLCLLILRKDAPVTPPKTSMKVSGFLLALMVCFGVMFAGNMIGNGLSTLIGQLKGAPVTNPLQEILTSSDVWMTMLPTVIVAPFGEEFIFRRLIIDRTRRYGELPAILLSAAMFAAFHMNLYQIFYAFLVGCVLGYVYIKTGRLRYSIAMHAIINFMGGVYPMLMLQGMMPFVSGGENMTYVQILVALLSALGVILLYLIYIGCLIATIVLACMHLKRLPLTAGEGGRYIWRSPFVILFFAVCVGMTVLTLLG